MMREARYWIEKLSLAPHPEGGYFKQTYRAPEEIAVDLLQERFSGARAFSTAIYYLLQEDQFSALHRLKSDEIWHFYAGCPLTLHVIERDGRLSERKLGSDPEKGEAFQRLVKAGNWFGATVNDPKSYSLAGCTMAPGFELEDFEMGDRGELIRQYPEHSSIIERLTR